MADRDSGIDLINDNPGPHYLAGLVCNMVGCGVGVFDDNRGVVEFRATIHGFYIRLDDDEEIYVRGVRSGKILPFELCKKSKQVVGHPVCDECGDPLPVEKAVTLKDGRKVCFLCFDDAGLRG